jgi:hypothetical protein
VAGAGAGRALTERSPDSTEMWRGDDADAGSRLALEGDDRRFHMLAHRVDVHDDRPWQPRRTHTTRAPWPRSGVRLSYHLSYHGGMARREKRSISLPFQLAQAIDQAAVADGTNFSAWLADTAAHRLRLEAGRRGIAEWEHEHGPLSADELADGLAVARDLLSHAPTTRSTRRSA